MIGGSGFNEAKQDTYVPEKKSSTPDKIQIGLDKMDYEMSRIFSDDYKDSSKAETVKSTGNHEISEKQDSNENSKQDTNSSAFKEFFDRLFSMDILMGERSQENHENENSESNIEKQDPIVENVTKIIGTAEGIGELIEKHPEKAELWKSQLAAIETLNNPESSPIETARAQAKLSILKGQIMEVAVKDVLSDSGFDVEAQQRVVVGESGGTRPDVIAVNNTEHPIDVFGITVNPGETLSIECKCGGTKYMTNQLNNHIPNQLSGHEGTKVLFTTSDINGVPEGLASQVCDKYGAKLIKLDISVINVEKAIKEVAGS